MLADGEQWRDLSTLREIAFELAYGTPRNPVLRAFLAHPRVEATTLTVHAGGDSMWLIWRVTGPEGDLAQVRKDLEEPLGSPVETLDVAADGRGDLAVAARWRRPPASDGVRIENLLCDMASAGNMLRLRVHDRRIEVSAGGHDGEQLLRFYQNARAALANRYAIRLLRVGEARGGREVPRGLLRRDEEQLLEAALTAGYYDEPKRCGVRELGDALGFSKSVVARKLRTLERRALEQLRDPGSPPEA